MNKYFLREFLPERWHICNRENGGKPVLNEADAKPFVFKNEDLAMLALDNFNAVSTLTEDEKGVE